MDIPQSSMPCVLCCRPSGGFTSTPQKFPEESQSNIIPHQKQPKASISQMAPTTYPPGYEMKITAQEFHKLHKPKTNKLKGGYLSKTNVIFPLWLKDIKAHVEDQNLTERETIQLVKDFTTKCACDKVEFYMGMVVEDQRTFDILVNHLKSTFQLGETLSELISDFYSHSQRKKSRGMCLLMTSRFCLGRLLPIHHLLGQRQMNN